MRTCPRCTLINPDTATHCDCGLSFSRQTPESVQSELREARQRARVEVTLGFIIAGIALAISVTSFVAASEGGYGCIAYGGVVVGLGIVGRNLAILARLSDAKKQAEGTTRESK